MSRNTQRAGASSLQVQASGDINIGISEARVREIVNETAQSITASYAEEGLALIQERVTKLDDRVIASLIRAGRLEVFAEPGFQRAYKKAQEGAAVSEDDRDYDLLAGLIADRAERGVDRRIRAGIERSIEIVDQVDDDSLRAITVFQAIQQYSPLAPGIEKGLDIMEDLFTDLLDGPLPLGASWFEHLDILDAVRVNSVSSLRKFRDYYPSKTPGYLASGVPEDEAALLTAGGLPLQDIGLLIPHELRPGYVRLRAPHEVAVRHNFGLLGEATVIEILKIAEEQLGFGNVDESLVDGYTALVDQRPRLKQLHEWWDQIPQAIQVTSVGRVLARANALRLDSRGLLPPID